MAVGMGSERCYHSVVGGVCTTIVFALHVSHFVVFCVYSKGEGLLNMFNSTSWLPRA